MSQRRRIYQCRDCPRTIRSDKRNGAGPVLCRPCRRKAIGKGTPHIEEAMTAGEIEQYLTAQVELESMPAWQHVGRHVFPKLANPARSRCLKCNQKWSQETATMQCRGRLATAI